MDVSSQSPDVHYNRISLYLYFLGLDCIIWWNQWSLPTCIGLPTCFVHRSYQIRSCWDVERTTTDWWLDATTSTYATTSTNGTSRFVHNPYIVSIILSSDSLWQTKVVNSVQYYFPLLCISVWYGLLTYKNIITIITMY